MCSAGWRKPQGVPAHRDQHHRRRIDGRRPVRGEGALLAGTDDGATLVFNIHLSSASGNPVELPATDEACRQVRQAALRDVQRPDAVHESAAPRSWGCPPARERADSSSTRSRWQVNPVPRHRNPARETPVIRRAPSGSAASFSVEAFSCQKAGTPRRVRGRRGRSVARTRPRLPRGGGRRRHESSFSALWRRSGGELRRRPLAWAGLLQPAGRRPPPLRRKIRGDRCLVRRGEARRGAYARFVGVSLNAVEPRAGARSRSATAADARDRQRNGRELAKAFPLSHSGSSAPAVPGRLVKKVRRQSVPVRARERRSPRPNDALLFASDALAACCCGARSGRARLGSGGGHPQRRRKFESLVRKRARRDPQRRHDLVG